MLLCGEISGEAVLEVDVPWECYSYSQLRVINLLYRARSVRGIHTTTHCLLCSNGQAILTASLVHQLHMSHQILRTPNHALRVQAGQDPIISNHFVWKCIRKEFHLSKTKC